MKKQDISENPANTAYLAIGSNLGNKTVEKKIRQICKKFEHQGPMQELLVINKT